MSEKLPGEAVDLFKYNIDVQMERGVSLRTRTFTVTGAVDTEMFHRIDSCLNIFENESKKTITMRLCSEGGEIHAALAIIGRIKASPCKIKIEAYGKIMSAAVAIFACADVRVASKYTSFMWHQMSLELSEANLKQVRAELEQSERDDALFNKILEEHSASSATQWQNLVKQGQDAYLTAEQCLELGLVDKII